MKVLFEISDDAKDNFGGSVFNIFDEFVEGYVSLKGGAESFKKRIHINGKPCTFYMYKGKNHIHLVCNGVYCWVDLSKSNLAVIKEFPHELIKSMQQVYSIREFYLRLKELE